MSKSKAVEFEISGNLFEQEEVEITYHHPFSKEDWKELATITVEDIGIRIVDTGKYGYRYYDEEEKKFISREKVEERLLKKASEIIAKEFSGLQIRLEGELDRSGEAEFSGSYE